MIDDSPALGSSRAPLAILVVGFIAVLVVAYLYAVPLGARGVIYRRRRSGPGMFSAERYRISRITPALTRCLAR